MHWHTTYLSRWVRLHLVPMSLSFIALKGAFGAVGSAAVVGCVAFALAAWALAAQPETYGKDLDYRELA